MKKASEEIHERGELFDSDGAPPRLGPMRFSTHARDIWEDGSTARRCLDGRHDSPERGWTRVDHAWRFSTLHWRSRVLSRGEWPRHSFSVVGQFRDRLSRQGIAGAASAVSRCDQWMKRIIRPFRKRRAGSLRDSRQRLTPSPSNRCARLLQF
jgi:hypothetical protein